MSKLDEIIAEIVYEVYDQIKQNENMWPTHKEVATALLNEKQAIKDLMLEKVRNTPTLGPPHPQTTLYIEALEKEFSEL